MDYPQGYVRNEEAIGTMLGSLKYPVLGSSAIKGSGRGKVVKTWKTVKSVVGRHMLLNQGSVGSCVAFGLAGAANALRCNQIKHKKTGEEFRASLCPEYFYGLARQEIGRGICNGGDGAIPVHAIQAYQKYGSLLQEKYGKYDLRKYNEARCREWGDRGVPDDLEPIGEEKRLLTCSQMGSFQDCMDVYYNQGVCTFGSSMGLSNRRDSEGFVRWSGTWQHQMFGEGARDDHRPGILMKNSWPAGWCSGPLPDDIPPGSAWVPASDIDRACREGDCWGLVRAEGWVPDAIDFTDWDEA